MTTSLSKIPEAKYNELRATYSGDTIAEFGATRGSVFLDRKELVCTSIFSGPGSEVVVAKEIVGLDQYAGDIEPKEYKFHNVDVSQGKRPRGYSGMLVRCNRRSVVFTGPDLKFEKSNEGKQNSLF